MLVKGALGFNVLTHWGRVTHICVSEQTIIGSYNGLSPGRRQAIIWTSAGILLIGPLVTNFSEILIEIHTFLFKKMHLKMSSGKWRPFCLGLNVLIDDCMPMLSSSRRGFGQAMHLLVYVYDRSVFTWLLHFYKLYQYIYVYIYIYVLAMPVIYCVCWLPSLLLECQ